MGFVAFFSFLMGDTFGILMEVYGDHFGCNIIF